MVILFKNLAVNSCGDAVVSPLRVIIPVQKILMRKNKFKNIILQKKRMVLLRMVSKEVSETLYATPSSPKWDTRILPGWTIIHGIARYTHERIKCENNLETSLPSPLTTVREDMRDGGGAALETFVCYHRYRLVFKSTSLSQLFHPSRPS